MVITRTTRKLGIIYEQDGKATFCMGRATELLARLDRIEADHIAYSHILLTYGVSLMGACDDPEHTTNRFTGAAKIRDSLNNLIRGEKIRVVVCDPVVKWPPTGRLEGNALLRGE